jgi:hypothetical protein
MAPPEGHGADGVPRQRERGGRGSGRLGEEIPAAGDHVLLRVRGLFRSRAPARGANDLMASADGVPARGASRRRDA